MFYNNIMVSKNYKLQDFYTERKAHQIKVLASGWIGYYQALKLIYNSSCKSSFDAKPEYQWGVFIDDANNVIDEIDTFLQMMMNVVAIKDNMRQSFALGYHFHSDYEGEGRTEVGSKVYNAKPYNKSVSSQNLENAQVLAVWFSSFIERHPLYRNTDYLMAVPCKQNKGFDLPTYLVKQISNKLGIANGSQFVQKKDTSHSQKDIKAQDRAENIKGAFILSPNVNLRGKVITIIDDIYDTGSTINELGKVLQEQDIIVQGLTATRINRRSYNDVS